MKMNQLPIGFPEEVREWIREQAKKRYISEAGFVRQLVIVAMEEKQAAKEKQEEKK